jgi:hypothetical protein
LNCYFVELFDDGIKILSNAKDRYYVRSPDIPLMNEEKELLFIVAEQIEQIKNLKSAFLVVCLILLCWKEIIRR